MNYTWTVKTLDQKVSNSSASDPGAQDQAALIEPREVAGQVHHRDRREDRPCE
jgi:hypothetical protein